MKQHNLSIRLEMLLLINIAWLVGCSTIPATPIRALPLPQNTPRPNKYETTPTPMREMTLNPDQIATDTQFYKENSSINLDSNGQTFTFSIASRFSVFLDDEKYPISELTCEPEWVMGYISNGSIRGPNRYPIMYEGAFEGECTLRNGDFAVKIIIAQPTPVSPFLPTSLPAYPPSLSISPPAYPYP